MGFWRGITTEQGYQRGLIYNWLKPKRSGNEINGLHEPQVRRPTPLMWHRLKYIEHKLVQLLFQSRFRPRLLLQHRDIARHFLRMKKQKKALKKRQPNVNRLDFGNQHQASMQIKYQALALGAQAVGLTKLKPEWMFTGYSIPAWAQAALDKDELYAIVMTVQHDETHFQSAPSWGFSQEIARQYNNGSDLAVQIANWLLDSGYHAYGHGGPEGGEFILAPAAISAGIGELGKHGSLINPKLGANFRIALVYTTLALETDVAAEFGIDDFCQKCQICINSCPPKAISNGKKMVRGEEKFYVDFDKCMPYMTDHYGCGICLKVCPWSTEKTANKLYRKQQKRLYGNIIASDVDALATTVFPGSLNQAPQSRLSDLKQ